MNTEMNTGYQIYIYDDRVDRAFINGGPRNWFSTLEEAKERKEYLENAWSENQYIIVQCAGRDEGFEIWD